jgi:hypothetical protein
MTEDDRTTDYARFWKPGDVESITATAHGEIHLSPEAYDHLVGLDDTFTLETRREWNERRQGWRGWVDRALRRKPVHRSLVTSIPRARFDSMEIHQDGSLTVEFTDQPADPS